MLHDAPHLPPSNLSSVAHISGRIRRGTMPPQASLDGPSRVLVISGSYGAGHDSAAREIRLRLVQAGWQVDVLDVADLFPLGFGRFLRRTYFRQLQFAPQTWAALFRALDTPEPPTTTHGTQSLVAWLPASAVAAAVSPGTAFVVSTHPFASQALGYLREHGMLDVPTVTYLTDASVHPMWIHPFIDIHVAVDREAARQAILRGARDVRVIRPLTPDVPASTGDERRTFRTQIGVAMHSPIALISGGSGGAGDIRASARDVRDTGVAIPVVLCGRNVRLRRTLDREPGIVTVGWLDGLTTAIRGSDCVVQNAGGFTAWEALALGTPLISYRCLPGHGEESAKALEAEGLAPWPRSLLELDEALSTAVHATGGEPPRTWQGRPSVMDALPLRPRRQDAAAQLQAVS